MHGPESESPYHPERDRSATSDAPPARPARPSRPETCVIHHRRLPGLLDFPYRLEAIVHGPRGTRVIASSPPIRKGQDRAARAVLEQWLRRNGWKAAGVDAAGRRRFQRPVER